MENTRLLSVSLRTGELEQLFIHNLIVFILHIALQYYTKGSFASQVHLSTFVTSTFVFHVQTQNYLFSNK